MFTFKGKIPVTIHPIFFFVATLIAVLNSQTIPEILIWVGIIFFSVLIHEYGHALTAYIFGQKPKIQLVGLGGLTTREGGGKLKLWQEFVIVFNGPFFGLLLAMIALHIAQSSPSQDTTLWKICSITAVVNIFWTIVNLLPVHPLDGGHLLRIMLEGMFGYRGVRLAMLIGMLLGALASILFFYFGLFIAGALFIMLAFENYRGFGATKDMVATDRSFKIQEALRHAEKALERGEIETALEKCQDIRLATGKGLLYQSATLLMAKVLQGQGDHKVAFELLSPLQKSLVGEDCLLLHRTAYGAREWNTVSAIGNDVFQDFPSVETALINAAAHAALGEVQPATGWLTYAKNEGAEGIQDFVSDKAFDPIRQEPGFSEWRS